MSIDFARLMRVHLVGCGLLLVAASARSQEMPLPPVKNLSGVWNVTSQACNGNRSSAMQTHPDQKEIEASRRLTLPSLRMEVALPQLPNYSETTVNLVMNDRSRSVRDHYILFSEHALDAPSAAIVITELPKQWAPTKRTAFKAVVQMERASALPAGLEPVFSRVPGPFGEALETINPGRISSRCFPTSDWRLAEGSAKDSTLSISRFAWIDSKLVQFALILKVGPQLPFSEQADYARKIMNRFWLSLIPRTAADTGPGQGHVQAHVH